ncbi:hypothetical protein G4B88_010778 [Cannabis sativa]|uniref:Uncharacterized protein n=1 Tax=Cannabis sativa TaxID=3483 RepID=A0A7J6GDE3_CANSA|nr:hypothetical protein G4B88_010778 [Cannabis sativa]
MAMTSNIKVSIFADTNLGTRIAMAVPPEITAVDFKRKFERVHCKYFAGSGEIEVCGLMVKKKSRFYYLPDSIPMKYAFQGVRGTWFLHVEAKTSAKCFGTCLLGLAVENSFASADKSSTKGERKKYQDIEVQSHKSTLEGSRCDGVSNKKTKRERKEWFLDYNANENGIKCTSSDTKTEVRRKKYSKTKLDDRVESFPKFAEWSPSEIRGPEVGRRLQMASNNLGSSASKKNKCFGTAFRVMISVQNTAVLY